MQLNVLNDLAEAKSRWTAKKMGIRQHKSGHIKKTCAGLCDHGYCGSASCRVRDGFHAKRSGKGLFDGGPVKIVLVVSGCRHDKKAVGKAGAAFKCETNVSRSAATPVDFCLSIPQYKLIAWWSFGNASRCEAAELP